MTTMDKRQRLEATFAGQPVDRPAVALWRHWPGDDQHAEDLARATLGSYADLAAIAALQTVGEPCAAAETIAVRNGVELSGCELSFGRVVVEVKMTAPELLSRFSNIDVLAVTARAGY